jgi:hypothetical protein
MQTFCLIDPFNIVFYRECYLQLCQSQHHLNLTAILKVTPTARSLERQLHHLCTIEHQQSAQSLEFLLIGSRDAELQSSNLDNSFWHLRRLAGRSSNRLTRLDRLPKVWRSIGIPVNLLCCRVAISIARARRVRRSVVNIPDLLAIRRSKEPNNKTPSANDHINTTSGIKHTHYAQSHNSHSPS